MNCIPLSTSQAPQPAQAQPLAILIRPMVLQDVPQVVAVDRLSFALPWSEKSYRFEVLENDASLLWVAETACPNEPPLVVGMIVVWLVVDEAHVATIAVHPAYRGIGLARRLLAAALRQAIPLGARLATLEVRRSNTVAQALYQRFGFQVVGKRAHYYNDNGEDALIMTVDRLDQAYLESLPMEHHENSGGPHDG